MGQIRLHSLNDVKLVGRLTKDPELRFTTQGTPVCRFRLAVGRRYKAGNDWKEEVAFIPCTLWRDAAERAGQRLKKGSPVFVEGRLKSRDWTTKEGQKRSDLEVEISRIQFLESMGEEGGGAGEAAPAAVGAASESRDTGSSDEAGNIDDEVPF